MLVSGKSIIVIIITIIIYCKVHNKIDIVNKETKRNMKDKVADIQLEIFMLIQHRMNMLESNVNIMEKINTKM